MDSMFDISHADALTLMTIEEDKEFLLLQRKEGRPGTMMGVDEKLSRLEKRRLERVESEERRKKRCKIEKLKSEETVAFQDSDDNYSEPEPSTSTSHHENKPSASGTRGRHNILTPEMSAALDRTGVSDRDATYLLSQCVKQMGSKQLSEVAVNRESIRRTRKAHRETEAMKIKSQFEGESVLIVHWDGKLLPDITGDSKVDRLPVIVSEPSTGTSKLLAVPKLGSGTGEAQAGAVVDSIADWKLTERVRGMCFDTTASNTGWRSGACVLIEQKLGTDLLYLACRHHIMEIIIGAAFGACFGPTSGPTVPIFKRFQDNWKQINAVDYENYTTDQSMTKAVGCYADNIEEFAK